MKKVNSYMCETCGEIYRDKDTAKRCEKSHHLESQLEIIKCEYWIDNNYPVEIFVSVNDGSAAKYRLYREGSIEEFA